MEKTVQNPCNKDIARLSLHSRLCDVLKTGNVYFQPPPSIRLVYPAIVYKLEDISIDYANNNSYINHQKYSVTLIDANPDSPFIHKLTEIPKCRFSRSYQSDGLNHWTFMIYS